MIAPKLSGPDSHRRRQKTRLPAFWLAGALAALVLQGCGGAPDPGPEEVKQHALLHPAGAVELPQANDSVDAYLDYSAGMANAMQATSALTGSLQNFLKGREVRYWRVGAAAAPDTVDPSSPAGNFLDRNNFTDLASKLMAPLDAISKNQTNTSVFFTDFERVEDPSVLQVMPGAPKPHPIDVSAWAQVQFKNWLLAGNRLDIFAQRFDRYDVWFGDGKSAPVANWVYVMVFTPAAINDDPKRFQASAASYLAELTASADATQFRHLTFSGDGIRVVRGPSDNSPTGYANPEITPITLEHERAIRPAYDYYEFANDDVIAFIANSDVKKKNLLANIPISIQSSLVQNVKLGLSVSDVTDALAALPPPVTPETEADDVPEDAQGKGDDKTIDQPIDDPKKGPSAAKKPPQYDPGTPVENIFELDWDASKGAAGIRLNPDYIGVDKATIYRVAVVVSAATPVNVDLDPQVLSTEYSGGYRVRALAESLTLALRDVATTTTGREVAVIYIKVSK